MKVFVSGDCGQQKQLHLGPEWRDRLRIPALLSVYMAVWEKGKQAVKEQKSVKIGILEQKNLGYFWWKTCLRYTLRELRIFPPFMCLFQVLQARAMVYSITCPCGWGVQKHKAFLSCQGTEAGCGKSSRSHSSTERLLKCRRVWNGIGKSMCLAVIILEEKKSMGSSRSKAALCTAVPRENRAPQHIAFGLYTSLPTPSCKVHFCLCSRQLMFFESHRCKSA